MPPLTATMSVKICAKDKTISPTPELVAVVNLEPSAKSIYTMANMLLQKSFLGSAVGNKSLDLKVQARVLP